MSRKTNPEKDAVISSASGAAARPRRVTPAARKPRSAQASETSLEPVREPETPARATTFVSDQELSHDEIARLAYALWEARGRQGGTPEEDWLRAEEQLRLRTLAPAF